MKNILWIIIISFTSFAYENGVEVEKRDHIWGYKNNQKIAMELVFSNKIDDVTGSYRKIGDKKLNILVGYRKNKRLYFIDYENGKKRGALTGNYEKFKLKGYWDGKEVELYPYYVPKDMPKLNFETDGILEDYNWKITQIVVEIDNKIQVLKDFKAYPDENLIILEDMNFDGYYDIRIKEFTSLTVNIPYICWIYNPKKKKFELNDQLKDVVNIEIEYGPKELVSDWQDENGKYIRTHYKYKKGRYKIYKEKNMFEEKLVF